MAPVRLAVVAPKVASPVEVAVRDAELKVPFRDIVVLVPELAVLVMVKLLATPETLPAFEMVKRPE